MPTERSAGRSRPWTWRPGAAGPNTQRQRTRCSPSRTPTNRPWWVSGSGLEETRPPQLHQHTCSTQVPYEDVDPPVLELPPRQLRTRHTSARPSTPCAGCLPGSSDRTSVPTASATASMLTAPSRSTTGSSPVRSTMVEGAGLAGRAAVEVDRHRVAQLLPRLARRSRRAADRRRSRWTRPSGRPRAAAPGPPGAAASAASRCPWCGRGPTQRRRVRQHHRQVARPERLDQLPRGSAARTAPGRRSSTTSRPAPATGMSGPRFFAVSSAPHGGGARTRRSRCRTRCRWAAPRAARRAPRWRPRRARSAGPLRDCSRTTSRHET